ncbi:unnamed protein product [Vitrella brassicaformis CCMP3155]|uniref:Uncharacterized protein n=1 Tax=Vitrella brassicaformis (strain CCMP3155) TaxID=1169540 RepID=A0A0G4EHJ4_VITBC|nr:unnamed protein product [Vitrella brassicaformis CCMP3155]|eukprot:CEL95490.1 unnamed protein product [Vitrella brassicaformis CCMP3155]
MFLKRFFPAKPKHQDFDAPEDLKVKCALVGNAKSGKTAVFKRYLINEFDDEYIHTEKAQLGSRVCLINEPLLATLTVELWDTPEVIEDPNQIHRVFSDAHVLVICVDVLSGGVVDFVNAWIENELVQYYVKENQPIICALITKCDFCAPSQLESLAVELDELVRDPNKSLDLWVAVSAKDKSNLEGQTDIFKRLSRMILMRIVEERHRLRHQVSYDANRGDFELLHQALFKKKSTRK